MRLVGAYVNRPETRSMTGSHILVESIDGLASGHLTVLLVHVVGAGTRIVADPDAEVLDLLGALLMDLELVYQRQWASTKFHILSRNAPGSGR
jgi:hypothetical protein